jgi:hypothetical protein
MDRTVLRIELVHFAVRIAIASDGVAHDRCTNVIFIASAMLPATPSVVCIDSLYLIERSYASSGNSYSQKMVR